MSNANWTGSKIKYELTKKGWPYLRDVDRKFGLPHGTITNSTQRSDERGERIISDLLQVDAHVIWPSRYDTLGNRLQPQPSASYTPTPVRRQCQKAEAA